MALREFRDDDGKLWQVWRTMPSAGSKMTYRGPNRRGSGSPEDAPLLDRRGVNRLRRVLLAELQNGWLCFESQGEKRRLVPVPANWDTCSEAQLVAYWAQAETVSQREAPGRSLTSEQGNGPSVSPEQV